MGFLIRLRRLSRSLPIGPALLHRLRRLAWCGFLVSAWMAYGSRRKPGRRAPGPICVVGFHRSVLGLGEAARNYAEALRLAGAEVVEWDISALFGHEARLEGTASPEPPVRASTLVVFLNPRELVQLIAMTRGAPFKDRFCVGFWFWELEVAPPSWRAAMRYVDEIWVASRFVGDAVAGHAPKGLPIRILPCPVALPTAAPDRAAFGLPEDKTVVLTAFDVRSGFTRKNPIAAVRAFRQANVSGRAVMICKAAGLEGAPDLIASLKAEIGQGGDVRFMPDWLTGPQMKSLIASADIILSLHRSEGFGLTPAQGMAAGKAVLATGWSASVEFMAPDNGLLTDYVLVPVQDPQGLYDGGRWAEPDGDDAAAKLRVLIEQPEVRQALGAKARHAIGQLLDPAKIGAQARQWLEPPQS